MITLTKGRIILGAFIAAGAAGLLSAWAATAHAGEPWNGFSIGAHGGYAVGEWDGNLGYSDPVNFPGVGGVDVFGPTGRAIDSEGAVAGGQLGLDLRSGSFVYGIEVDASWADLAERATFPTADKSMEWTLKLKVDAFGTVRARVGYLVSPALLVYGTGGLAWARTSLDQTVHNVVPPPALKTATASVDETHVGWTAGAGAEWAIAGPLRLRAEWLHVDLGEADYRLRGTNLVTNPPSAHTTDSFPADLVFDVFRIGVSYRFAPN